MKTLREGRQFPEAAQLAEAIGRREPQHAPTRVFYAQALIELGYTAAATCILNGLLASSSASGRTCASLQRPSRLAASSQ